MDRKYNKNIVTIAKTLRKNMTKEERHLWGVCEYIDMVVKQSLKNNTPQ